MADAPANEPALAPLPDRPCGSCNMCCKVFNFPELSKPAGTWCRHIVQGKGCTIYEERPDFCRAFFCMWRLDAGLGPEWKPDRARFVLSAYPGGKGQVLAVTLDPGAPGAWRKEPYYSQIKAWARAALPQHGQVIVVIGARVIVPLPASDVDLGVLDPGDRVEITQTNGTFGVRVVRAKDASA
jgi:hypothetical protein